jgi:predicted GIY-YIG superfamily endonuclease
MSCPKSNASVYALVDPSGEIRYVGVTKNPDSRIVGHVHEAQRTTKNSYKLNWIRSVLASGQLIEARLLEENVAKPMERECYWIKRLKTEGHRLTNLTSGGDGMIDMHVVVKRDISASVTERWKDSEYRKRQMNARRMSDNKIRQSVKALWADPAYRKKMLDVRAAKDSYNKRWSKPGAREDHSKTMSETFSKPANRRKLMKTVRASHTPAMKVIRSAIMKRRWQDPEYRERMRQLMLGNKRAISQ